MTLSIPVKQNCIYFALIVLVSLVSVQLYISRHQEWILYREAEKKYDSKEFDGAINLYKKSLEAGLPPFKASLNLANSYVATGHFEEAISLYRDYLLAYPKDTKARLALAEALSWMGRLEEAEMEYQKILEDTHENKQTK